MRNVKLRGRIEIFFSRFVRWTICRKSITLRRDPASSSPTCDDWSVRIRRTSDVEITCRRREMQAEPN
ncbi:unnamed protein product [Fusarium graminearum]|nr:unnamed protein product [Fusarium graminearum]